MKKVFLALIVLVGLSLVWVKSVKSKDETPPGLEKKPPLEKRVFIHYKKDYAKPPQAGGKKPAEVKCYGFLSKGAKLKSTKDLYVNTNVDLSAVELAGNEWGSHTAAKLFGSYIPDATANWDSEVADGRSELVLGDYPQSGVIAVTVAWGYFSVPPSFREITEFDVLFDKDYVWGEVKNNSEVMDWQNIATHEIGHGVGMGDVYQSGCSLVTMYGYSDYGEIQKRTLELQDIAGLLELYGN
jgi:hypothetical protein